MTKNSHNSDASGKNYLFACLLLVIVLGIAEGLARGVQFYLAASEFPAVDIPAKQPGEYRVMLYGGSTVEGAPLNALSFVNQLEFQLQKQLPDRPIKFINLGRSSKSSAYVRAMMEKTLTDSTDLVIVLSGHNEFLFDRFETAPTLSESSLLQLGQRLITSLRTKLANAGSTNQSQARELDVWDRSSDDFKRKLADYDANMRAVVAIANKENVPLLLGTLAANLSDWPPAYRDIRGTGFDAERTEKIEQLLGQLELLDSNLFAKQYAALQSRYPDDASLAYAAGVMSARADQFVAADRQLRLAKDSDPLPWRVLSSFNETVRALADQPNVYLADIETAFSRHAGNDLVGFELVADNCHPTPLGSALMARELLSTISAHALLPQSALSVSDPRIALDEFLSAAIEPAKLPELWQQYFFTLAKYSMKGPFYNFSASQMYSERQLELDPEDWRAWANLGTVALLQDNKVRGERQLQLATKYKGSELDPDDRAVTPYLRRALDRHASQLTNTGTLKK